MIVRLDEDAAAVLEADDLKRLHVEAPPAIDDVDAALRSAGIGTLAANGDAMLDVAELRSRARSVATATDWDEGWAKMIDFATSRGWVSDDGRSVQAHVARPE